MSVDGILIGVRVTKVINRVATTLDDSENV